MQEFIIDESKEDAIKWACMDEVTRQEAYLMHPAPGLKALLEAKESFLEWSFYSFIAL